MQKDQSKILARFRTRTELAQELGLARETLARWKVENKGPPATKVGRKVLYDRESTERWLHKMEEGKSA